MVVHSEEVATSAERVVEFQGYTNILNQLGDMTHSVKMVCTGSIVQASIKIKYFEVTILSFDGSICIGLATLGSSLGGLQFGIDSQGALIHHENLSQHNYYVGRPLEVGDTIGTGWDRNHKSLFFTFNGRQLDTVVGPFGYVLGLF